MINIRKENDGLVLISKNLLVGIDTEFGGSDFQIFSLEQTKKANNLIDSPGEFEFKNTSIIGYESGNKTNSFLINFNKQDIVFLGGTQIESDFFDDIGEVDILISKIFEDSKKLYEIIKELEPKILVFYGEKKDDFLKNFSNIEITNEAKIQDTEISQKTFFLG